VRCRWRQSSRHTDRILPRRGNGRKPVDAAKTFGYNPDVKDIPNDPAQAKKLLVAAGFGRLSS